MIIVKGGYTAASPHLLTDAGVRVIGRKSCRAAKPRAEESVDGDMVTKEPNSAREQGDGEDTWVQIRGVLANWPHLSKPLLPRANERTLTHCPEDPSRRTHVGCSTGPLETLLQEDPWWPCAAQLLLPPTSNHTSFLSAPPPCEVCSDPSLRPDLCLVVSPELPLAVNLSSISARCPSQCTVDAQCGGGEPGTSRRQEGARGRWRVDRRAVCG